MNIFKTLLLTSTIAILASCEAPYLGEDEGLFADLQELKVLDEGKGDIYFHHITAKLAILSDSLKAQHTRFIAVENIYYKNIEIAEQLTIVGDKAIYDNSLLLENYQGLDRDFTKLLDYALSIENDIAELQSSVDVHQTQMRAVYDKINDVLELDLPRMHDNITSTSDEAFELQYDLYRHIKKKEDNDASLHSTDGKYWDILKYVSGSHLIATEFGWEWNNIAIQDRDYVIIKSSAELGRNSLTVKHTSTVDNGMTVFVETITFDTIELGLRYFIEARTGTTINYELITQYEGKY